MTTRQNYVIVGASLAGAKAAETLRDEGFDGRVVLIGAEAERPYERPPLTKEYLRGEAGREKLYVHDEGFYAEHDIELRLGTRVDAIDPDAREVRIGEEAIGFDRLLLATGAEPRRLGPGGAPLDGLFLLRSVADADALRERLPAAGHLVVVGAGWIGSEVAASARQRGVEVTVLEPAAVPLERVLGAEAGAFYRDLHIAHGVDMRLGTGVDAIEGEGAVQRVRTSDGQAIECDLVVVGIGVQPRTALAEAAGLDVANGIVTDGSLQTSVAGIFAAGDVANHRHPRFGALRVEHWANALHQGPAAAQAMLGRDVTFDRTPYFFSDQYDAGMEYTGYAASWDEVVFRGDPAGGEFIAFWLAGGRVLAGMNVNVWDVADDIERLVRGGEAVDRAALADPGTPLAQLAGTARADA